MGREKRTRPRSRRSTEQPEQDRRQHIEDLEARLREAEETIEAIRCGKVDALVISGTEGEQIYTLRTAEHPYRVLVEAMSEGAVTVNRDGTILYCNHSFGALLRTPSESLLGTSFPRLVAPADRPRFAALLEHALETSAKGEVSLIAGDGSEVPAHLSLSALLIEETQVISIVVTDLSEQKRHQELIASERLSRSILEQAAEAMVVCNEQGRIVHASHRAHELCAANPVLRPFDEMFPLKVARKGPLRRAGAESAKYERLTFSAILESKELRGVEATFERDDGETVDLLLSAGLIIDSKGKMLGCVATMIDITERKHMEAERELLLRQMEEASRLKDEFLATLSHELRNPLNSIIGYADILRRSPESRNVPIIRQATETIHRNAEAQAQLIDDLLDLSRLQTGKLAVEWRPMALGPVLGDAVESVRRQAAAKGLRLEVDLPEERLMVNADPVRVQQIVWNLVNNAVKFTPRGGRVSVILSREDDEAKIVVEDTGQGIDPDFLPCIFDMFRQSDSGITRRHGGLGIGLALVKQLVELHGGEVEACSDGLGRGARFTVRLPLYTMEAEQERAASSLVKAGTELPGANILVVDDSEDSLEMLRLLLTSEGATVTTAADGKEALELARRAEFDLIISDISMPGMDGYNFLRNLRTEMNRYLSIPAIALTGFGRDEDVERARQAGFTTHLTKPLDFEHLLQLARVTLQK